MSFTSFTLFLLFFESSHNGFIWPVYDKMVAIVDYEPLPPERYGEPEDLVNANARNYIDIIKTIKKNYPRITFIVFPESTLDMGRNPENISGYSTPVHLYANPCMSNLKNYYAKFFGDLSCAARKYSTNLLLNVIERDGLRFYSTDVVFSQQGLVYIRNRKDDRIGEEDLHQEHPIAFEIPVRNFMLYEELLFSAPGYFMTTKFQPTSVVSGFRFGYDKIVDPKEYRHYLISSNWISELPFLTSLQVYQMWSQEFNLTIYVSGANEPRKGMGGSGIFHSTKGPIAMNFLTKGKSKYHVYSFATNAPGEMLTAEEETEDVDALSRQMDKFHIKSDDDIQNYKSKVLDVSIAKQSVTVCYNDPYNDFCCKFSIAIKNLTGLMAKGPRYTYHMIAYKGYKSFYSIFEPGGIEICALVACLDSEISSCGKRFKNYTEVMWPIVFKNITVKANFSLPRKERIYYSSQFPNSLLSSVRPIHPNLTIWRKSVVKDYEQNISVLERAFSLREPMDRILTFGIFGRNFSLVGEKKSESGNLCLPNFIYICIFISINGWVY